VIYDPRFARDLQSGLTEDWGRNVGGLPLHPAADIYYHRNDLLTSDRLGRLSFVASGIAALAAAMQFITRLRRAERVRQRRRLLGSEIARLGDIRRRIDDGIDAIEAQQLIRDADAVLCTAEQDAAAELLDPAAIEAVRSIHQVCWRAFQLRRERPNGEEPARPVTPPPPEAPAGAPAGAAPGHLLTPPVDGEPSST